ncbi:hypothetical protein D3C80_2047420 [compost metagenome]
MPVVLRFFADDVDHAARILDAVQQRSRAFQHFNALGGGIEIQPLAAAHAVAVNGAVRVGTETAAHKAIFGARQRVAFGDTADKTHRIGQACGLIVL